MSKGFKALLIAATMSAAAIATPSNAGENNKGFYVGLGYGASTLESDNVDWKDATSSGNVGFDDESLGLEVGIGYDFGNNFRTEFNYGSASYDIDNLFTETLGDTASTGDVDMETFMVSVFYDIDLGDRLERITPYIGAGFGTANFDLSDIKQSGTVVTNGGDASASVYEYTFGVSYATSPKLDIFGEASTRHFEDFDGISSTDYTDGKTLETRIGARYRF